MKITDVRSWIVTGPPTDAGVPGHAGERLHYVFVQVDTDEGLTGWGEITTYPGPIANKTIAAALRELERACCVGDDPTQVEALWHKVFRAYTYLGTRGAVTAMISGVDIACWDIKAQALGVPIYQLLGGKVRENVPMYTHFEYKNTVEGMSRQGAGRSRRAGDRPIPSSLAIKIDPFSAARAPASSNGTITAMARSTGHVENLGVKMIEGIRKAIGPDIQLLIDAHALYNVPTGVRLANRLAEYDIWWFEEPCPPESYDALESVRNQVKTRICVGERLYTRFEFLPVLNRHLDRLRDAGRDLDRRHLGVEEDRDAGRDLLHPDLPARRQRPVVDTDEGICGVGEAA